MGVVVAALVGAEDCSTAVGDASAEVGDETLTSVGSKVSSRLSSNVGAGVGSGERKGVGSDVDSTVALGVDPSPSTGSAVVTKNQKK